MERLAISETTTFRWSFEEDVENYKSAGIRGIGVWRQKLSDFGEERGVDLIHDSGLNVSSLLWAGGFTGSDGRSFKESIEDAKEAINLAVALSADCLVLYTGGRGGHTHNHARRLIKAALTELVPIAAERNVTLALEPMHAGCAAEWTFLTELDDTLALIDSVETNSLKLVFDTYHWGHRDNVIERMDQLVPRIALVQLGDAKAEPNGEQNRCPIGEGILPVREIVHALNDSGYQGSYEVELLGEDIEAADYDDLIVRTKHAFLDIMGVSETPGG